MKDPDLNERDALTGQREIDATDGLVEATRAYFASDFPNAQRSGCPPREVLKMAVRSNSLPDDELRAHLFTCSECFQGFRIARQAHQEHLRPAVSRFWLPIPQPRAAFAAVILFLLASISVVVVWRPLGKRPVPPVANITDSRSETAGTPSMAGKQLPEGAARQTHEESSSSRNQSLGSLGNRTLVSAISIDLRRYTPLGAAGREPGNTMGDNEKVIRLPASRNRLLVNLPRGNAKGIYVVSIVERAFLKPLIETAPTSDGKSLTVTLDMRTFLEGEYLLAISRVGEAPVYYRLVVNRSKRATRMDQ